jgi:hypothetical protein
MNYLISRRGQEFGPYSLADIKKYVAQGSILKSDFAWTHGMQNWIAVEALLNEDTGASASLLTPASKTVGPISVVNRTELSAEGLSSAAARASLVESRPRTMGNALTWPFHQEKWFEGIWIPLLAGLCATIFVPALIVTFSAPFLLPIVLVMLVGLLLGVGWTIDAMKRQACQDSRLLPEIKDMGRMFKDSLILSVGVFCFAFPLAIFAILVQFNKQYTINVQFEWMVDWTKWGFAYIHHLISGTACENFASICARYQTFIRRAEIRNLLVHSLAPLYIALAIPMFAAGMIRFALTEKFGSFFHVFGNAGLLFRHFGGFVKFIFLFFVLTGTLALSLVFIETLLVPLLWFACSFWITAKFAGGLAAEVWKDNAKIRAAGGSVPAMVRPA